MLRRVLFAGLISIFLVSCNVNIAPSTFTSTPTSAPTNTLTPAPPTLTATATPVQLTLHVTKELVNCRLGPGLVYELINELSEGQSARVVGRNDSSTWWYVRDPGNPNGYCWLSADVTEISGDSELLPIVLPPGVYVIDLNLVVEPQRIVLEDCTNFPQTFFFEAEVTSNGPLIALWQWEASTGVMSETSTLVFEQAGTQVLNQYYQVPSANDYWVRLHITSPNEMIRQVDFRAVCST